jgi:hypothetical protein
MKGMMMKKYNRTSDDENLSEIARPGKKKKPRGKYGIERYSGWFQEWYVHRWYPTAEKRDQAFEDLRKHTPNVVNKEEKQLGWRKVDRE